METETSGQQNSQQNISQEIPIPQQEIPIPQLSPQGMGIGKRPERWKKSHTKLWIAIGAILAVLLVAGITVTTVLLHSPKYLVAKAGANLLQEIEQVRIPADCQPDWTGVAQTLGEDGGHVRNRWNVSSDVFAEWLGQSVTLGVDTEISMDKEAEKLNGNVALSVMNNNLLDMDIYAEQDTLCFSVPALFLEDMYFSSNHIVNQYNHSIWADYHRWDGEDFSIPLFETYPYCDREAFAQKYAQELTVFQQKVSLEKAEQGLYRLILPQAETEALLQAMLEETGTEQEIACQELLQDDVKLLLEIDAQKRIESMVLEEPVAMLDGDYTLDGELFFLGKDRSIDKIQGKIVVTKDQDEVLRLVAQLMPTVKNTTYGMEASVKCTRNGQLSRIDYQREYDSDTAGFRIEATVDTPEETVAVQSEGAFEDIGVENTLHLDLDRFAVNMDGRELYKITGELLAEPLQQEITETVEARTAFFEMTEEDWERIALQVIHKYETLWEALQ